MSGRRSRLDAVLRVRRLQEELAQGDLLRARREEELAHELARSRRTAFEALPTAAIGAQPTEAFLSDRFRRGLSAGAVVAAAAGAGAASDRRAGRQSAGSHAAQRTAAVERLTARQRAVLVAEALRVEQAAADEVAVARWAREVR